MNEEQSEKRLVFIGTPNCGKIAFLPYLTGRLEVNPPIAEAMFKLGYITKQKKKQLINKYKQNHIIWK